MNKLICNKFDEYKKKQKILINNYKKNYDLAIKLCQNYHNCWRLSDLELRQEDNFEFKDPVFDKVYFSLCEESNSKINEFYTSCLTKINKRKMTEKEYTYLLNNSLAQIIRDNVINEFVSEKSLLSQSLPIKYGENLK